MKTLTEEEYKKHKDINLKDLWKHNCPFCNDKYMESSVIWRWKFFYIAFPLCQYLWIKNHLMVIPYKHRKYTYEMSKNEFWELKEVEKFMKDYYKEEDYFSFVRESMWKRSIEHLHYHFLPWVVNSWISEMLKKQWFPKN